MKNATASVPNAEPAEILTKAVIRAGNILQIKQMTIARILGLSAATVSRLHSGHYLLNPERGKEWEFALLFIRLFRSIDAILGHGESARKWLTGHNLALDGRPLDLIETTEGLIRVLHYLDAHRGRI